MRSPAYRLQQLRQPPLPQVSVAGRGPAGSRTVKTSFSTSATFMSFSPFLNRSPILLSPTRTAVYGILFRFGPRLCSPSPPTPNISAPASAFSPSFTPGDRISSIIPGGGISADGKRWISCRPGFFLPVRVLSRLFRRLFLDLLRQAFDASVFMIKPAPDRSTEGSMKWP